MNEFWEIVKTWEALVQVGVLLTLAVFVTIVLCLGLRTIRVVFRGYPPPEAEKPQMPQVCNSDDNLTGYCLKSGGCKTTEECDSVIAKHNGNNSDRRE